MYPFLAQFQYSQVYLISYFVPQNLRASGLGSGPILLKVGFLASHFETGLTDTVTHSLDNTDTGGELSASHSSDPGAGVEASLDSI